MHLRRALLLFAIVLGLAALASSVSQPQRETTRERPSTTTRDREPTLSRQPSTRQRPVRFSARTRARRHTLKPGVAATIVVSVAEPGQVELEGLGLVSPAEPLTPARFELRVPEPGSFPVRFLPAGGGQPRKVGVLVVRA